jgi:hypothetical protein
MYLYLGIGYLDHVVLLEILLIQGCLCLASEYFY